MSTQSKLLILGTTIATTDGIYSFRTISLAKAKSVLSEYVSLAKDGSYVAECAIQYESVVGILNKLLGTSFEASKNSVTQAVGQSAIALRVMGRPDPKKDYTLKELEEMGYEFKLMKRIK